mgnify:CR=1 FL=1
MRIVYVVAIKLLNSDCWEYAYTDNVCYHGWCKDAEDADSFWDIESAEKWFNNNKVELFRMATIFRGEYDIKTICIKKVTFVEPIYETEKDLIF